ncbi:MAG: choice-of-anchor J domain-containing protein [Bacteroidales bacterium]|jgi:hypothetical protein|nr:choice-of-anchor J domain-containing protein [Bacteroidales bacterium]
MKKSLCFLGMFFMSMTMILAQDILFEESFENAVPPAGWLNIDADADGDSWQKDGAPAESVIDGYSCAVSRSLWDWDLHPDNYLITPLISLPANKQITLSWWDGSCWMDSNGPVETYSVLISTTNTNVASFTNTVFSITRSDYVWAERTVDLSSFAGSSIYIAFRHHDSYNQSGIKIDKISLTSSEPQEVCPPPTGITIETTSSTTASVQWDYHSEEAFRVILSPVSVSNPAQSADMHLVPDNHYLIHNLVPDSSYTFYLYLQANCGDNQWSTWAEQMLAFQTLPEALVEYEITPSVNNFAWGSITPAETITVKAGEDYTFTFEAKTDCEVEKVVVDTMVVIGGDTAKNATSYTFTRVSKNATIIVFFKQNTGIQNFVPPIYFTIYPNPVTHQLQIKNNSLNEIKDIEIYSFTGQKVNAFTKRVNENGVCTIDVSHLPSGVYFLKIDRKITKFTKN